MEGMRMKKFAVTFVLLLSLTLCGCGASSDGQDGHMPQTETSEDQTGNRLGTEESEIRDGTATQAVQGGPYGELSILIPAGWECETYLMDSNDRGNGLYGIHFYPENVNNGYIEIAYIDSFGVCGTGLEEKTVTVAGNSANIGTYDGHEYWDFISFGDQYEGIVALTYFVDDWWSGYEDQVMDILDTVSFDKNIKEGGAYVYSQESEISEIGLYVTLKKISPTGATLVFNQYDPDAATGDLQYGNDFAVEVLKDGKWESAPIVVDVNYAFDAVAYVMKKGESSEQELNWEWLYGELAPGEYRIRKKISDFRETGDYDTYTAYAHFFLN